MPRFANHALFSVSVAALLMVAGWTTPALAGGSTVRNPFLPADQVAAFSDQVQQDLAARGARVAIVSRMGRDPSQLPAGVRYTHVAFWVYSQITLADGSTGTGYRVYNLYQDQGDSSRSSLVQDSPVDFFAGAKRLDAGVIIPDPRLQQKLLKVIASPTYARLHNKRYSVLSNPNTSQHQNCTEHTLDVLTASLYGTGNTAQIKANITAHFTPQHIPLSSAKRSAAAIVSRGLTTADHGEVVRTATFSTIAKYMKTHRLAKAVYTVRPGQTASF